MPSLETWKNSWKNSNLYWNIQRFLEPQDRRSKWNIFRYGVPTPWLKVFKYLRSNVGEAQRRIESCFSSMFFRILKPTANSGQRRITLLILTTAFRRIKYQLTARPRRLQMSKSLSKSWRSLCKSLVTVEASLLLMVMLLLPARKELISLIRNCL